MCYYEPHESVSHLHLSVCDSFLYSSQFSTNIECGTNPCFPSNVRLFGIIFFKTSNTLLFLMKAVSVNKLSKVLYYKQNGCSLTVIIFHGSTHNFFKPCIAGQKWATDCLLIHCTIFSSVRLCS